MKIKGEKGKIISRAILKFNAYGITWCKNDKDEYEREKHGQPSVTFTSLITLEKQRCVTYEI